MIDPRALQQHFQHVQQNERPQKESVPRILDIEPLTAVQAIPEPVIEEKNSTQVFNSLKKEINFVIDAQPPIPPIVVDETETQEGIYDPYNYYSSF